MPRYFFNSLPAKPEYLDSINKVLREAAGVPESLLIKQSRLTKTQALCALTKLIKDGQVEYDQSSKLYRLK